MIYQKKVYNMEQSKYYVTHYFNAQNAGGFLIVSLIGLIIVLAIVLIAAKLQKHYKINAKIQRPKNWHKLMKPTKLKF